MLSKRETAENFPFQNGLDLTIHKRLKQPKTAGSNSTWGYLRKNDNMATYFFL